MRLRCPRPGRSLLAVTVALLLTCGCGRKAQQARPAAPPPQATSVPLPEWAPKNPSPEFLRAAQVLKPLPAETQGSHVPYVEAWEFFGMLTDQQLGKFLQVRQVKVLTAGMPETTRASLGKYDGAAESGGYLTYRTHELAIGLDSLTQPQRKAFDKLALAWQRLNRGGEYEDILVQLYKMGAKADLSNAELVVSTDGARAVSLSYRVHVQNVLGDSIRSSTRCLQTIPPIGCI